MKNTLLKVTFGQVYFHPPMRTSSFLICVVALATLAAADNEVYTIYPAAELRHVITTAYCFVDPQSWDLLQTDSGYAFPGIVYGFFPPFSDYVPPVPPFLEIISPKPGDPTGETKPDIVVLVRKSAPIDTTSALLALDSQAVTDVQKTFLGDTLRFVLPSSLSATWHPVQVSIADTAGIRGQVGWQFRIQVGAPPPSTASDTVKLNDRSYAVHGLIEAGDSAYGFLDGLYIGATKVDAATGAYDLGAPIYLPVGHSTLTIYGVDANGDTVATTRTVLVCDNQSPTLSTSDKRGRLRNDTLLTGIAELMMRFSDTLSGLDTSSLALKVNGQTAKFDSVSTVLHGAGKRMASSTTLIGQVLGVYRPPILENHASLLLQAEIKDNLGNTLRDSLAFVVVKTDSLPPTLVFADSAKNMVADHGASAAIRFRASDDSSKLHRLRVRFVPTANTSIADSLLTVAKFCTTSSTDSLSAKIDWSGPLFADLLNGFSYVAEATDEYGNTANSSHRGVCVAYDNFRRKSLEPGVWQMFSVPLAGSAAAESLETRFGKADPQVWRWARYHDSQMTEHGTDADFDSIAPGRAFWIHHRADSAWQLPTGRSVTLSPADTFVMALAPGWNQIGNPFLFDVEWRQVRFSADDSLIGLPYAYDTQSREYHQLDPSSDTVKLAPWGGFWLQNRGTDTITMSILPSFACSTVAKRRSSPAGWSSTVLVCSRADTTKASFGEWNTAAPGKDKYDAALPPSPEAGRMRITLRTDSGALLSSGYSNLSESKQGETFPLVLWNAPQADSIWIAARPRRYPRLVLWDADLGLQVEMGASKAVPAIAGLASRRFELWAGTDEYIARNAKQAAQMPAQWAMRAFPNPFNPVVNISYEIPAGPVDRKLKLRLYQTNGALVKTLASAPALPGRYSVTWNGQVRPGVHAATGFYLLRLECTGSQPKVLNQKLLLLK